MSLRGATLGVHADTRFHSRQVTGKVVDGVLIAEPIELRFPVDIMIVRDELFIHQAWLRLERSENYIDVNACTGL